MKTPWPEVILGEVIRQDREPVGTFDGDALPVLGVTNVEGVTHTGVEASDDKSKYLRLRPGRFVYNPYRINVGSIGLSSEHQDGICSPAYVVFAPTARINANYLRYFLKSAKGSKLINFHGNRGSVRSALRFDDLCEIEIPLPPLAEQQRIVARIEILADQIHEAQSLRQHASAEVEAIWLSAINAVAVKASRTCGGILTALDDASALVTDGAHNTPRYVDIGVPLLTAKNIFWNGIDTSNVRHISREEHEPIFRRCPAKQGDVLFINIGATTGTACKVNFDMEFSLKNAAMIRTAPAVLNADFLVYLLRGPAIRDQIAARQAQTCQPFLALRDIRSLNLPVPPISEQRIIVAELNALQAEVDRLKALQTETAAELDALLPSILDRAFKGDL